MHGDGPRRSLTVLLLLGLGLGPLTSSCTSRGRHDLLALVLDGVPPYVPPEERARHAAEVAAREAEARARAESQRARRYRPVKRMARFIHGPYANKECSRCHDLAAAFGFRKGGGSKGSGNFSKADLAEGGRLRMPVTDLCVHCHTDFAAEDPSNDGSWLHGPVASGWCVMCHQPHSSPYPHLVARAPAARLCGQCHRRADLVAFTEEHRPTDPQQGYPPLPAAPEQGRGSGPEESPAPGVVQVVKDCTRCHDPHRGPDHFILKAPREAPPGEPGMGALSGDAGDS